MGNTQSEDATFNKNLSFLIGSLVNNTKIEGTFYRLSGKFLERNFPTKNTFGIRHSPNDESHAHSEDPTRRIVTCAAGDGNTIVYKNIPLVADGSELFIPLQFNRPLYTAQTYVQWKSAYDLRKLHQICHREKRTIYIQPLDNFPDFICDFKFKFHSTSINFFGLLSYFCRVFFCGIDVTVLPKIDICAKDWNIKKRHHSKTDKEQLLVTDFETKLQTILPTDGLCILGIIWTDLYPSEDLNFVLGQAFFNYKSGIFCFGRFEPKTYDEATSEDISKVDSYLILKLLKVLYVDTVINLSIPCLKFKI